MSINTKINLLLEEFDLEQILAMNQSHAPTDEIMNVPYKVPDITSISNPDKGSFFDQLIRRGTRSNVDAQANNMPTLPSEPAYRREGPTFLENLKNNGLSSKGDRNAISTSDIPGIPATPDVPEPTPAWQENQTKYFNKPLPDIPKGNPETEVPTPVTEVPTPVAEVPTPVAEVPTPVAEVPEPNSSSNLRNVLATTGLLGGLGTAAYLNDKKYRESNKS